jgi:hypothetical protein
MNKKTEEFLGGKLLPDEALGAFRAFKKADSGRPEHAQHVGKFPEAVLFTIKELREVLDSAESYLKGIGVKDDERWMAFYFIIPPRPKPTPASLNKPSVLMVGTRAVKNQNTNEFAWVDNSIIRLDHKERGIEMEEYDDTNLSSDISYELDFYDMGDRHPPKP